MKRVTNRQRHMEYYSGISIHALREEGARLALGIQAYNALFLSTPSARRATPAASRFRSGSRISIHALREEGDGAMLWALASATRFLSTPSARRATSPAAASASMTRSFLSTPSARRATRVESFQLDSIAISIHALREEGDICHEATVRTSSAFLSTPSARRATRQHPDTSFRMLFLSTPSARRATAGARCLSCPDDRFLSTPSARRTTFFWGRDALTITNFYPRPPRGGRLSKFRMFPQKG